MSEIVKRKKTKLKISTSICCDSGFLWAHPCGDFLLSVSVHVCACCSEHVEVRGQLEEVDSLLPLCGSWESNSCCQAWRQAPFLVEPSCLPKIVLFCGGGDSLGMLVLLLFPPAVLGLRGNTSLLLSTAFSGSTLSWGRRFNPGDGVGAVVFGNKPGDW